MAPPPRPPAVVLQLAELRGTHPGKALSRRVEETLQRTELAIQALVGTEAVLTRSGGRLAKKVMSARELLFRAQARLLEASGEGAIPAPRKPETVIALHEQVRGWLAQADRTLKTLPPEVLAPPAPAVIRTLPRRSS